MKKSTKKTILGCITVPFLPLYYVIIGWLLWKTQAPTWIWVLFWLWAPLLLACRTAAEVLGDDDA